MTTFGRVLASTVAMSLALSASAQSDRTSMVFEAATLYSGQGVDHNLLQLPGAAGRGQLKWEPSRFTGASLRFDKGLLGQRWSVLADSPLAAWRFGHEWVLLQHRGLQHNAEMGAALVLRTPTARIGPLGLSPGTGVGLSYALGRPNYEDGPADEPERRYRLQLLALFDVEWTWRDVKTLAFVTRVHHRSGVYGLIAPSRVGSNFLALGLRWRL